MSYSILRTDQFNDQLRNIIFYIADDSGSVETALHVLDQIENDLLRLREFPESGNIPRYAILKRQGYRVLITMRWLVFYKVDHRQNAVILYAITDQRQEYRNLL